MSGAITRTFTFTDGTVAYGSQVDSEIQNIVTSINGCDAGTNTWTILDGALIRAGDGSVGNPAITFKSSVTDGLYKIGANNYGFAANGVKRMDISTAAITCTVPVAFNPTTTGVKGTTTNDNASTGIVGEYLQSAIGLAAAGSTNTWTNYTSVVIPSAGDWDITGQVNFNANGATINTSNTIQMAVSTGTGTNTSDHVLGDNVMAAGQLGASQDCGTTVSNWRQSLSAGTTIFLKTLITFTVATPRVYGRLSVRRVR